MTTVHYEPLAAIFPDKQHVANAMTAAEIVLRLDQMPAIMGT